MKTADLFLDTHFVNNNKIWVLSSNYYDYRSNPYIVRDDSFTSLVNRCITVAIHLISKKGYNKVIIDTVDYKTVITITDIHGPKYGVYSKHNNIDMSNANLDAKLAHVSISIDIEGRYDFTTFRGRIRKLIYNL